MVNPGALLDVQRLDNNLEQLRYRHAHLPEREALALLDTDEATLARATKQTRDQRDVLRKRERSLEDDANDLENKAKQLDTRLYDGSVTSPKDATAVGHEIEVLKERQSHLEDEAIELMVEIEPLDEQLVQAEALLGEMTAKRAELDASLAENAAELDVEIAAAEQERAASAASVDPDQLEHYRQLRITYGPDAVVEFDAGKDGGCPVAMSAVELDRWKHLPSGTIDHCVDCGRLVIKLD